MIKPNNKILALQKASQAKREGTLDKVRTTIQKMKDENLPINLGAVAKLAGISRTWLYKNDDLKSEIASLRQDSSKIKRVIDMRALVETRDKKIASLKEKNLTLKAVVKKLRRQLEFVYGELYKAKKE